MKHLSSYGFTPVSEASSCGEQSSTVQQKRPRTTESVSEGRPSVNPDNSDSDLQSQVPHWLENYCARFARTHSYILRNPPIQILYTPL